MVLILFYLKHGEKSQILSAQLLKTEHDGIIFEILNKKDSGNSGFREDTDV